MTTTVDPGNGKILPKDTDLTLHITYDPDTGPNENVTLYLDVGTTQGVIFKTPNTPNTVVTGVGGKVDVLMHVLPNGGPTDGASVNFQLRLTDVNGTPVPDSQVTWTFYEAKIAPVLFADGDSGKAPWSAPTSKDAISMSIFVGNGTNQPIVGYSVTLYSIASSLVYFDKDGNKIVGDNPASENVQGDLQTYTVVTDNTGEAKFSVASTNPGVLQLSAGYGSANFTESAYLTYLNEYSGGASGPDALPAWAPPLDNGVLDLDKYSGAFVSVSVSTELLSQTSNMLVPYASLVINDKVATQPFPARELASVNGVPVSKSLFNTDGTTNNTIYYIVSDSNATTNQSSVASFPVKGASQNRPDPSLVTASLKKPSVPGASRITSSTISNGLQVVVPSYTNMTIGDEVSVTIYLNAYYSGTSDPRSNAIKSQKQTVNTVGTMQFNYSQRDLSGYCHDTTGLPGTFDAQYTVTKATNDTFSQILTMPLDTYS